MRSEFSMAERIHICRHHEGGRITNKALSLWASKKMGKPISEMTISRILIRKIKLLGSDVGSNRKHFRKPECPNLESILYSCFLTMQEANVTISDAMLIAKAKMLSNSVPRESAKEFKFSNGWLQGFKSRHGISSKQASMSLEFLHQ
ncbi:hypothetical protein R1flu_007351 [Riccia fluitans]|uniref:HTH CENPB-type domain-containing protein n=1 Tax=Riccia fluitans TaxID=41844 RepID=A0ABD1Z2R2_9MARC